jgi:rhodanese-related sulfurtransferase
MAEEVARFLAQLGYRKMTIMSAGYRAWEEAGYPVEKRHRADGE